VLRRVPRIRSLAEVQSDPDAFKGSATELLTAVMRDPEQDVHVRLACAHSLARNESAAQGSVSRGGSPGSACSITSRRVEPALEGLLCAKAAEPDALVATAANTIASASRPGVVCRAHTFPCVLPVLDLR
jgi:hypothetical protein